MTEATKEDFENDFTTIRIWREDKAKLEAMRVHERQGLHEIVRNLIHTANNKAEV